MNQLGTVYATKRRRRNGKSLKPSPKESSGKSNPSKRHRERLNAELDTLASLLPYEASILSKLDRLSILRLSVSYLRTKSYFQVSCHKGIKGEQQQQHQQHGHFLLHDNQFRNRDVTIFDSPSLDGESFLQALNGFLLILTSDGEVFFATHTIESYLGFHQSDVVHQSVYELVHSEDREELQRQLTWSSQLPADSGLTLIDALRPDNSMILERSFTVRFRCLLDNTSGFLRLDIRGRVKVLHGQNRKMEEPPLALFAICTPFGPPSLLELPHKESMFKSKHRLDLALVSMDQRGKALLGHSDAELSSLGGYDLVHFDDLSYVASAHQELLKTGASGLIAYRLQTKDGQFQWLQTSSRLVYKNSKPDFIISTHRPLMEEEGRDLMGKRTMDFKVSYLDAGLTSNYFTDQEAGSAISAVSTTTTPTATSITAGQTVLPSHAAATTTHPAGTQKIGRKYKNQLRDFLTNCRTKRKSGSVGSASTGGVVGNGLATPPEPSPVHYLSAGSNSVELAGGAGGWTTAVGGGGGASAAASSAAASAAVAAAATAYSPSVYPGASVAAAAAAAATVPYHADATNSFYHSAMHHHHHHQLAAHHHHAHHQPNATLQNLQNLHQSFYGSPAALDHNRFGIVPTVAAAEHNLFHHGHAAYARGLGVGAAGYYAADYAPYVHAAAATTNGFLTAGYDSTIGGMSQLYGGSSNSSPAGGGGGGGGGSPSAVESKYVSSASTSTTGGVSSLGRLTSLHPHHHHHHNHNHAGVGGGAGAGLGLLSSGETEPSSESSGTSTSSIAGGDSPYNNGHHNNNNNNHHHHHHQQQQQQQRLSSSRPNSRKTIDPQQQQQMMQQQQQLKLDKYGGDGRDSSGGTSSSGSSSSAGGVYPGGGTSNSNDTRQTVLMWGSSGLTSVGGNNNNNNNSSSAANDDGGNGVVVSMTTADLITSSTAAAVAAAYAADCGVSETGIKTKYGAHHGYNGHHQQQQHQQQHGHHVQQQHDGSASKSGNNNSNNNLESNGSSLNSACKWGRVGPHYLYGAAAAASAAEVASSTEVSWPPHHHHHHHPTAPHHHHPHQYYPYPYHHHAHHHHQSPHQLNF
ncbi:hypothetical protein GHT06_010345 [Daphnia sinensis]|uniref:Aryl hydrocarbon receptor n=1 Tax=Daphnia sinensis TaxID=1820382 RepID=A0AAD5Q0A6_9CRUS|nr:hypothetical protein GHT06_010345 [Daphnia sinensis]